MLAKKYKLPIQDFVGTKGRFLKNSYFSVKIFPTKEDFSRFGVTISNKTAPKATVRNRLRRIAYDFAGNKAKALAAADYWITILGPAAGLPKVKFIAELSNILK